MAKWGRGMQLTTPMQLVLGSRMPGTAFISQNDFLALCVFKNKRIWRGPERGGCPQRREEENDVHIWRLTADSLKQQKWTADNLLSSSLRVAQGAKSFSA